MREPATALTDFALALLALVCLALLRRGARVGARLFFAGFAAAAVLGGIDHGFLVGDGSSAERVVWWLTVTCTGIAAFGLAAVGLECLGSGPPRGLRAACLVFAAAFGVYAWHDTRFLISVLVSSTGSALALAGLTRHAWVHRGGSAIWAIAGLMLSLVAGLLQQQRVAVHPEHFDHNATYHIVLMPALGLFYAGNRWVVAADGA